MNFEEVDKKVRSAIGVLCKKDEHLFEVDAKEEAIAHKFAQYLQNEFTDWNVDVEYNRLRYTAKFIILEKGGREYVYPDIIIHHRNTKNNLLVIEVKKTTNRDNGTHDRWKLQAFLGQENYKYKFALFIRFAVGSGCQDRVQEYEWVSLS